MWTRDIALKGFEEALNRINSVPEYLWQTYSKAMVFLNMGEYEQAETLLLSGLDRYWFSVIHFMSYYGKLAECAIELGRYESAWRYIQHGLHHSEDDSRAWGTVDILAQVLKLLTIEGQYPLAVEIVSFMTQHPANIWMGYDAQR